MPSVLVTSRTTLMHAALAYLSDEIRAFDDAVASRSTVMLHSKLLSLPSELLSIIRSHLLLAITAQLMDRSATALKRYESALRVLLCQDCIAYNDDVYGKDVWSWEQFSGACGCLQRGWRVNNPTFTQPLSSTINPKRFIDRVDWLEYYLSRKSLRFLHDRTTSPRRSPDVIWDAVSFVLDDFDCKLVLTKERRRRLLCRDVVVMSHATKHADEWLSQMTLKRLDRDLGLSLPHTNFSVDESSYPLSPFPSRPYHPYNYQKLDSRSYELAFIQSSLDNLTSLLSTLFAIPVAFTTLFLTLVCLYSRPGAFRVM